MIEHHGIDLDATVEHIVGLAGLDRDDWDGAEIARQFRFELADRLPAWTGVTDTGGSVWYDTDVWHPSIAQDEIAKAEKPACDVIAAQMHDDPEAWTR